MLLFDIFFQMDMLFSKIHYQLNDSGLKGLTNDIKNAKYSTIQILKTKPSEFGGYLSPLNLINVSIPQMEIILFNQLKENSFYQNYYLNDYKFYENSKNKFPDFQLIKAALDRIIC